MPFGLVTTTFAAPTEPAGVTAVTVVEFTATTLVAGTPPIVTDEVPARYWPVIVIAVPPVYSPLDGEIEVTDCNT